MKDRSWCANLEKGYCSVAVGENKPTEAILVTVTNPVTETLSITNTNDIDNYYRMNGDNRQKDKLPKQLVVCTTTYVDRDCYECGAKRCRSQQLGCSHFEPRK